MKTKHWMFLTAVLATSFIAHNIFADDQLGSVNTNAPHRNVEAKKHAATPPKKGTTAKAGVERAVPLSVGDSAVAMQDNINIRGKAAVNSDVVTKLKKGDKVTVLESVTLKSPKADEPAKWYKVT